MQPHLGYTVDTKEKQELIFFSFKGEISNLEWCNKYVRKCVHEEYNNFLSVIT